MKKKVLIIIPTLEVGGTTSSLETFCRMLDNDYNITIAAISFFGDNSKSFCEKMLPEDLLTSLYTSSFRTFSGINRLFALFFKMLTILCRFFKIEKLNELIFKRFIRKVEKTDEYDAIIAFQEGISTKVVSYSNIKKRIAWVHCDYRRVPECGRESDIYSAFEKIVCVSEYTAGIFKKIYPTVSERVTCVYNPLDIEQIKLKASETADDVRFDNSLFTIVSVGRVSTVKRFEEIPKIAAYLRTRGCKFRWYVLGPIIQQNCYETLKNEITKYDVADLVVYLGNKNNPYPYMRDADVLVSVSKSEACPMIFNEAKILSLPIVSTDFGSSYEFIEIEKNGYISSLENIGEHIYKLYNDKDLYDSMKKCFTEHQVSNSHIHAAIVDMI